MCIFCKITTMNESLFENRSFYGVWDINPVQEGHLLVMSKKHRMNISELSDDELFDMVQLQRNLIKHIEMLPDVLGVTTLFNNGDVMMENTHFHFHLIPRYEGDGFYDNQKIVQHNFDSELLQTLIQDLD